MAVSLSNQLVLKGHEVEFWARKGSYLLDFLHPQVEKYLIPFTNDYDPRTISISGHALMNANIDIIYVYLGRAGKLSGVAGLLTSRRNRKKFWPICTLSTDPNITGVINR